MNRFVPSPLWAAACLLLLASSARSSQQPPNVLFIFVDDQGYYDLSCYGASEVDTPRIDALATQGVRFTDYYAAAPICSPSRAGLLTGMYPRRVGLATWVQRGDSARGIHPNELTIAELFSSNGYATACIGKWHLGHQRPFLPQQQGFDHYFGLLHNLDPVEVVHFEDQGGVPLLRNNQVIQRPAEPAQLTRRYSDEAIDFIAAQAAINRPFFVYLPHTMLHVPLGVSSEFEGKSRWGLYGDAIAELDFHVGRLVDTLQELGIADNTVIVYASDNGRGPGRTDDQPLRGNKLTTYEAGIRVPCIAWGPGRGIRGGFECDIVTHAMDWYLTLASLAGIRIPEEVLLDGRDLSGLLQGHADNLLPADKTTTINGAVPLRRRWAPPLEWRDLVSRDEYINAFFYHGSEGQLAAVRWNQWKLVLNPSLLLYDLQQDPGESKPIRRADIQRKLRAMTVLFQEEMLADRRPLGQLPLSP